jgi:hypothetical protein
MKSRHEKEDKTSKLDFYLLLKYKDIMQQPQM